MSPLAVYPKNGKKSFRLIFLFFICVFTFSSCKKTVFNQSTREPAPESHRTENPSLHNRNSDEIEEWLEDKQTEFGEAGSVLIEKIKLQMRLEEKYTESYGDEGLENFIVVPLQFDEELTEHIRSDLSAPLQYLLIVEDANGQIKRGDLVMFYPDSNVSALPGNAFNQFFTTQTFSLDGTFQLVSLNNIRQYEMDIENSNPKEFRLWEGRAPMYEDDVIVCIDWWLVTTVYYSDGTTQVFVEFLYSQCYGPGGSGGGGGSNGSTPPQLDYYPITKTVTYTVWSVSAPFERWTLNGIYQLSGQCYPNNSAASVFTSAPVPQTPSGGVMGLIVFGTNTHAMSGHPWYMQFSILANPTGLENNDKTAWAHMQGHVWFPNQTNVHRYPNLRKFWQAAIELHSNS